MYIKWLIIGVFVSLTAFSGSSAICFNKEMFIDIYTPPCAKYIAGEKLLYNTGSPAWCSVMTLRGGIGEGRKTQEGSDKCIIMADLLCCTAETNTAL